MFAANRFCQWGVLVASLAIAGCASTKSGKVADQPINVPPSPAPPSGASTNLQLPGMAADGAYNTINHGIGPDEAVWHLRSALNVAVLGCRGGGEKAMIANYNALLKKQRKTLAAAHAAEQKRFRKEYGSGWEKEFDAHTTKVYNFFAQPPAKSGFCEVSAAVGAQANQVTPTDFPAFAVAAVSKLEAPFIHFYHAYDEYQRKLAAWSAKYGTTAVAQAQSLEQKVSAKPVATATGITGTASQWRVQLGAFNDDEAARLAWSEARSKITAFAALEPRFEPVPSKNMVRLQAGPLKNRKEARNLCDKAIAAGQDCLPMAPSL